MQELWRGLEYDKRTGSVGSRGRALRFAIPELGLREGDRLEPSDVLPNIRHFEYLSSQLPVTVVFWRRENDTLALHRNPLFRTDLGITIQCFAIDVMHTLHLGVFKAYCWSVLWRLIDCDVWNVGAVAADVRGTLSVGRCRNELFSWCRDMKSSAPDEPLYELGDLTLGMLGSRSKVSLATKAAETGTLLQFCSHIAAKYVDQLGDSGPFLAALGVALTRVLVIMRQSPRVMPKALVQEFVDCIKRSVALTEEAEVPSSPKAHLMMHFAHLASELGNPAHYQTFWDEDYNGRLAKLAATCHRITFYRRVLTGFRTVLEKKPKQRRR